MVYTFIAIGLPGLLIVGLGLAAVKYRWFQRMQRWLSGDTRMIVEPPTVKKAVRCGKCYCKFTFTARDVDAGFSGSTLNCPGCNQRIRLWDAEKSDLYGVEL